MNFRVEISSKREDELFVNAIVANSQQTGQELVVTSYTPGNREFAVKESSIGSPEAIVYKGSNYLPSVTY